jgi:hypothetical protein
LRSILLAVLVFVSVACSAPALLAQLPGYNPTKTGDMSALDVSLIQLIANPESYDGKKVRIIGFLRLEFEGDALYLHQVDFEMRLMKMRWG